MELAPNSKDPSFSSIPWDLVVTLVLVGVVFLVNLSPAFAYSPLALVIGIVYLCFLPGYALIAALFPKMDDLQAIERIAYAVVLSVVVVPLFGFCLNYTSLGITTQSVMGVTSVFVVACVAAGWYRRMTLEVADRFVVDVTALTRTKSVRSGLPPSRMTKSLVVLLFASFLFSAAVVGYVLLDPVPREAFTEFYILGSNGTLQGSPATFQLGRPVNVTVGIANHENRDVTYNLVVLAENSTSSQKTLLYNESITVPNSHAAELLVPLTLNKTDSNSKIHFLLYRSNEPTTVYRETFLWPTVTNSST